MKIWHVAPTDFNGWIQAKTVGRPNNCQLSIVNCQFETNCQLKNAVSFNYAPVFIRTLSITCRSSSRSQTTGTG